MMTLSDQKLAYELSIQKLTKKLTVNYITIRYNKSTRKHVTVGCQQKHKKKKKENKAKPDQCEQNHFIEKENSYMRKKK